MKKVIFMLSALLMLVATSCGGKSSVDESGLNDSERHGLRYVKDHLERGEKLVNAEFVEGPMPIELMTDDFKSDRDKIYKAGLDYNSCKTRGIAVGMEKAAKTIEEVQEKIQEKVSTWDASQGTSEYLFVLATVKTPDNKIKKSIWVFNPKTPQHDFTIILTKPVVNSALMFLNAVNGTLFEYSTDPNFDISALKASCTNPIVKFILDAEPNEVR